MKLEKYRLALVREDSIDYTTDPEIARHPAAAARLIWQIVKDEPAEVLGCLLLDSQQQVIGYILPYRGTIDRAAVEPRGLLVPALLSNAAGVLIFHNHPSGDPSPSAEDIAFTKRCDTAGEAIGVNVVDHIIHGRPGRWSSLRQQGHMS